ncbi:MAG: GNAT family N-acetyltransferase [Bacteriovoracaceae bacterium]|jgi:GNAT superfamily N-acetyltransferase|nr:hypothetical protein [Halobacteriovoraceae bacterium]MDP7321497.1 GNAT family N-acetyltransferase [Bacteriovoracaceae bacterium]|tara:strand:- start:940 stop:1440 length:501 start_codon:yes stop_codon:yes gene_type:complete
MKLELRKINDSQTDELQVVFENAPHYIFNIDGVNFVPEDCAKSTLEVLPPGITYENKYVFLVVKDDKNIGVIDLINGYPSNEIAYIGLLLLVGNMQGKGLGKQVYELLEKYIVEKFSVKKVRLSYVESNPVSEFWDKMGFLKVGGKNPYSGRKNQSFSQVMEKRIS